jgi:hypothetical protein
MTAKDPLLADSAVLNALGDQMAAILEGNDLGTSRLRAFMNDIGYFGRAKGTPPSLRFWGKSLTEGDVKISSDTYTVKLLSQRVNYITDPKDGTGIISVRAASPTEADVGQALPFTDTSFSGGHPYSPSGTIFASAAGISYVMVRVASLVPIHLHDHVALSIHSGVGTDAVKWARLVTQDGLEVGAQPNPTRAAGAKAFDVEVITGVLS